MVTEVRGKETEKKNRIPKMKPQRTQYLKGRYVEMSPQGSIDGAVREVGGKVWHQRIQG